VGDSKDLLLWGALNTGGERRACPLRVVGMLARVVGMVSG
jgi:hypothetical protein